MHERNLMVGGLELLIRSDRAELLDAFLAPFVGYVTGGGPPQVVLEFRAVDGFATQQPSEREYPGFAARTVGREIELVRQDCRGRLVRDGAVITGRFEGLPLPFVLEAALRVATSLAILSAGGLMLHSSGIASRTHALLFSGPSGAGKTTISRLLADAMPYRLGDDLTIVRPNPDGVIWAHATPFAGEIGPAPSHAAPLKGLYFLVQAAANHVTALAPRDAMRRILRNTMTYVTDVETSRLALDSAAALAQQIPCQILEFTNDATVARVLPVT